MMHPTATTFYLARELATPGTTWAVIVLFGILVPGVPLLWALVARTRHRLHARQAAQAMSSAHDPTHLGPLVLAGKVADDGEGAAVTLAITQRGREWQYKGSWNHEWREVERAVTVRPFYVVRPSGERVRVEPDERVFLVDRLDGLAPRGNNERVRSARLTPGELVFVVGMATHGFDPMRGGYRDGAVGYVVRPARGERMLLSTEPLTERHKRDARHDGILAALLLSALVLTHGVVFLRAWSLRFGHVEEARIEQADTYQTYVKPKSGRGYWVTHYRFRLATDDKSGYVVDTSSAAYFAARAGELERVPLLVGGAFHQIGSEAACSDVTLMLYPPLVLFYVIAVWSYRQTRRPWYLRDRVIERLSGHLSFDKIALK